MKKFLLYSHGGSYNHGEEAIVKTTIEMIRRKHADAYVAICSHFPEQDREFQISADEFFSPDRAIWEEEKRAESLSEKERLARLMYREALDFIAPETVLLSVGGDHYCYANWHRWAVFQQEAARQKAKSILWGCSIDPSAFTPGMVEVLSAYTHILAREPITYRALLNNRVASDVQLLPDPAFLLEPTPVALPDALRNKTVAAVNMSPLVIRKEPRPGVMLESMRNLILEILSDADKAVALVPHVTMPMDNDSDALRAIANALPPSLRERCWLVAEEYSAAELKYIISQCSLLVCARTHASIAAYSSGVPTLVVGYSIKSVGIAEALGMSDFVVNASDLTDPQTLTDMYRRLCAQSQTIQTALDKKKKDYSDSFNRYMECL